MNCNDLRTLPKHIVFLSQLLLLFQSCHSCKADNPLIETREVGTNACVTTICSNLRCPEKTRTWYSQPLMPATKMYAGNFLLCMSTLLSRSSFSKVCQLCLHMGLGCVSVNTYSRYLKVWHSTLDITFFFHITVMQASCNLGCIVGTRLGESLY